MLDQRRAKQRGYITLKEAAEIANYTPDYLGQLIRAGKIRGEQVYSSVAWVTTKDEVQAYLDDKARVVDVAEGTLLQEHETSYVMYGLIGVVAAGVLLLQYILFVSLDTTLEKAYLQADTAITMHIEK